MLLLVGCIWIGEDEHAATLRAAADQGDDTCTPLDADGDGYAANGCGAVDCDDASAAVHPYAEEVCNGVDDDCDGGADADDPEGAPADATWYHDADGDGFGTDDTTVVTCDPPGEGWTLVGGDCDDAGPDIFPGAPELCDGVVQDCDAPLSEDVGRATWVPAAGAPEDWTDTLAAGTPDVPVALTIAESGTLSLCASTWYVNIRIAGPYDVIILDPLQTGRTVLDGAGAARVVEAVGDTVQRSSLTVSDVQLQQGFVADDGDEDTYEMGAGLYVGAEVDAVVTRVVFTANYSEVYGGGLAIETLGGSLDLSDSTFEDNYADKGGGLYIGPAYGSDPQVLVSGVSFTGNEAFMGGGAHVAGTADFDACTFAENHASHQGGAVSAYYGFVGIQDCTLEGNSSDEYGGALHLEAGSIVTLTDTAVDGNEATEYGGAASCADATLFFHGGAVQGNTAGFDGGGLWIEDDGSGGTGASCVGEDGVDGVGVFGNTAELGEGDEAWLSSASTLSSEVCDWAGEVYVAAVDQAYTGGTDATFACDDFGCAP